MRPQPTLRLFGWLKAVIGRILSRFGIKRGKPPGTIVVSGSLDLSIDAPYIELTSANLSYPPTLKAYLNDTVAVGDTLRVIDRNRFGTITNTFDHVLTLGEATAVPPAASVGLTALTGGTNRLEALILRSGNYSATSNIILQGPDDIPPVLSAAATPNPLIGSATANCSVVTDTAEGTLYLVTPDTNVQPTATQIKTGKDASGAVCPNNSTSVSAAGTKTVGVSGLTATHTYYAFWLHRDAAGNETIFAGASFTTGAAAAFSALRVDQPVIQHNGFTRHATYNGLNLGPADPSREIYIVARGYVGGLDAIGATLNGNPMTLLAAASGITNTGNDVFVLHVNLPTGTTGDLDLDAGAVSSGSWGFSAIAVFSVIGSSNPTTPTVTVLPYTWEVAPWSITVDNPTSGKSLLFAAIDAGSGSSTWGNATKIGDTQSATDNVSITTASMTADATATLQGYGNIQRVIVALGFAP